jgi:Superinfection immunity protein
MPYQIAVEIVEVMLGLGLYFLPAIVADRRKRHDVLTIALFNACLGWTVFGWLVSLYWAFQPNPPVDLEREITHKRGVGRMRAVSQAIVQRMEKRATKQRDSVRR